MRDSTDVMAPSPLERNGNLSRPWLLVLAFLATAAPLATDLYLPSFPRIQSEFAASASGVQLSLTGFFIGMAGGQLLFGSLSDRFGRIKPLIAGTVGAIIASVLTALAPSLEVFVGARLFQGICGAAGVVIARAIVVDVTNHAQTARTMSLLVTATGIAPAIAPSVGAILQGLLGWRGVMWTLAALFTLMLLTVILVLRETHPPVLRRQHSVLGGFSQLFKAPRYLGYAGVFATTFATMMTYISASPFVYQNVMGFSPSGYGLLFGINAVGLVTAGYVSSRIAKRFGAHRLINIAVPTLLLCSVTVLALAVTPVPRWLLAIPMLPAVTSVGFIMGNSSALALGEVRHVSGSGSALLGASQFMFGALVAPLAGLGGEHTAVPMAFIMTATAVTAWILIAFLDRQTASHRGQRPGARPSETEKTAFTAPPKQPPRTAQRSQIADSH